MENKIFDYNEIITNIENIKNSIIAEYKYIKISTLGGRENTAIILTISLDKKEDWANGILENSRYYKIDIDINGTVENFTASYKVKKIRKRKVESLNEAIKYINEKLERERGTIIWIR